MGFKKDPPASVPSGRMTIAAICTFLQDEWRSHEAAKNQWSKERKTLLGRVEELELQVTRHVAFSAMADRRMRMLDNVLRAERGYDTLEVPALPDSEAPAPLCSPASPSTAAAPRCITQQGGASAPGAASSASRSPREASAKPGSAAGASSSSSSSSGASSSSASSSAAAGAAAPGGEAEQEDTELIDAEEAAEREADDEVSAVMMAASQQQQQHHQPSSESSAAGASRRPPSPHPFSVGASRVEDPEALYRKLQQKQHEKEEQQQQQRGGGGGAQGGAQGEAAAQRSGGEDRQQQEAAAPAEGESGDSGREQQQQQRLKAENSDAVGGEEREAAAAGGPADEQRGAGKRAPRAVQAVLDLRAAWDTPEEEQEKLSPGKRRSQSEGGDGAPQHHQQQQQQQQDGGSSSAGGTAGGSPTKSQRPSSAGSSRQPKPREAPTRFAANAGSSGFASNVGAGFQSGAARPDDSRPGPSSAAPARGSPASAKKAPAGSSGANKSSPKSAKANRPSPISKPEPQEDVFAMAADLGIWTEEDSPTSPPSNAAAAADRSPYPSPGSPNSYLRATPENVPHQHHHHHHHHHNRHLTRRLSFDNKPQRSPRPSLDRDASPSPTSSTSSAKRRVFWHKRQPLRSHLAPVWDVALEWDAQKGDGSIGLLSASEDGTAKLWSVPGNVSEVPPLEEDQAAAGLELPKDVEPRVSFRGHSGPVTCVGLRISSGLAYSGGIDGTIKVWNLPPQSMGLYSEYGSSTRQLVRTLEFHSDAVWSLAVQPSNPKRFVSASSDGTLRLWDTSLSTPGLRSYQLNPAISGAPKGAPRAQPCVVRFTSSSFFFMAGFVGGQIARFDMATGDQVPVTRPPDAEGPVTGLSIAPESDTSVFVAYASGALCRLDAGRMAGGAGGGPAAATVPAHQDGCSAVAVSHNSLQVATGSPSGVVRLWDTRKLDSHMGEATMHDSRAGEGVLSLAFSPAPPGANSSSSGSSSRASMLAAGGADGVVQLMALPP